MKVKFTMFLLAVTLVVNAQTGPEVTSWLINTTGDVGYNNIPSNVQQVQYSSTNVYVTCTCIPGYDVGPWAGNPNTPANQNFCFKITRSPQQNMGTAIATGLGHTGVWSNGVSIFNAKDAFSYNNQNVWFQDAYVFEGASFDDCLGHPAPNGEYHHHVNPTCLYDQTDYSQHSPIIGYSFDGFPIYGAIAYSNTNGTGAFKRMRSSYRLRNITDRTTLADGTVLQANQYGPTLAANPLGSYIQDYEYVQGLGDLDEHNGRFSITPDYPAGTYAYFVTIDTNGIPLFPYTMGPTYYGTVPQGNTGPQGGHNTPAEAVTTYTPTTGIAETAALNAIEVFPNPAANTVNVYVEKTGVNGILINALGQKVVEVKGFNTGYNAIDVSSLETGIYYLQLELNGTSSINKVVISR
jgi:hypothetical protein